MTDAELDALAHDLRGYWKEVSNGRVLKLVAAHRALKEAVRKLERGCDCEYDFRCSRCAAVLRALALAEDR